MLRVLSLILVCIGVVVAAGDWETVGGGAMRNGYNPYWAGPRGGNLLWSKPTLPSTIGMQVFTWDSLCVVGRYTLSPNKIDIACHSLVTGDTVWTRNYTGTGKYLPFGVRDGRLYVRDFKESQQDSLFCIDMLTGDILWRSPFTCGLGIVWSATFLDNGDPVIVGGSYPLMRIDRLTGDTVWTCRRPIPNSGAGCTAASGDRLFAWMGAGINRPKYLVAIDAATGVVIDTTPELPGDGDQEMPFAVGPGNVVYGQRDGGRFYAFQHTDTGFVELWTADPFAATPWMTYGIGEDSTVLVPRGRRLLRIDHHTGAVLDSSPLLTEADDVSPRIAIDRDGWLYLATGVYSGGGTWCLTPDLDSAWFEPMSSTYYTGPALGANGVTVIAGPGATIMAYEPTTGVSGPGPNRPPPLPLECRPNPFRVATTIRCAPGVDLSRVAAVFDASGREVRRLAFVEGAARWDGRDGDGISLPTGVYVVRVGDGFVQVVLAE